MGSRLDGVQCYSCNEPAEIMGGCREKVPYCCLHFAAFCRAHATCPTHWAKTTFIDQPTTKKARRRRK